jgi:hypothetical protein
MADSVKMDLKGIEQNRKLFQQLPIRTQDKVTGLSLGAARRIMVKKAQSLLSGSEDSGLLRKYLTFRRQKKNHGMTFVDAIGARNIKVAWASNLNNRRTIYKNPAKYFHLAEDGFTDRAGVFHRGKKFARRAFDSTHGQSERKFIENLSKGLEREARKLGAR